MTSPNQATRREPPRLRVLATLALLVMVGIAATACSRNNTSNTATSKIPIRIWRTNQPEDTFKSPIRSFTKDYPQVEITYSEHELDNSYELDALKSLAARNGPDVWSIPNDWLGDHLTRVRPIPENYFFPRDNKGNRAETGPAPAEQVKELYPAGIAEMLIGTDTKTVYGLPMNVDSLKLYVNPTILQAAATEFREEVGRSSEEYTPVQQLLSKAPATWQDLVEQAQYINQIDGNDVTRGTIAMGTADNIPYAQEILQLLMMQNGAKLVSEDRVNATFHLKDTTASGVDVRPGLLALDFFASFADPGSETYSWNPSMPEAIDAFGQGKVAMIIGFSDVENELKTRYPRLRFQVHPVPQKSATEPAVNLIRFSVETVTQTAENPAASFTFLSEYTSRTTSSTLAGQARLLSPYLETLERRESDPFVQQVLTGKAVYKKYRLEYDTAFRQMIVDVSQNEIDSEEAIVKAADSISILLQKESL